MGCPRGPWFTIRRDVDLEAAFCVWDYLGELVQRVKIRGKRLLKLLTDIWFCVKFCLRISDLNRFTRDLSLFQRPGSGGLGSVNGWDSGGKTKEL